MQSIAKTFHFATKNEINCIFNPQQVINSMAAKF